MFPFSAQRLAKGLGGEVLEGGLRPDYSRLSTDSRSIQKGDVYLALKGDRFDGEDFFGQAIQAGAAAVVGRRPPRRKGIASIHVADGLEALQSLARDQRRLFEHPVIAITGSNGKTGVKECLAHLMGDAVLATPGNWNNHVGLPLTILGLSPAHRAAVLELGMNHPGELMQLGGICKPDIALELNVGDAHIGFFKTRLAVAAAKEELLQSMGSGGIAVLNGDDPLVAAMGRRFLGRSIRFGLGAANELKATGIADKGAQGMSATLHWGGSKRRLRLPMGGRAKIYQALASLAAGLAAEKKLDPMLEALAGFKPSLKGRQQVEAWGGAHFILDTYNASPQSMEAGIELLELSAPRGRRLAVLGDMLELGSASGRFHAALGRRAAAAGLRGLASLGPQAKAVQAGYRGHGAAFGQGGHEGAAQWLRDHVRQGDWVLLKGSRGMQMEKVFSQLKRKD